jgi:hypothetical protein
VTTVPAVPLPVHVDGFSEVSVVLLPLYSSKLGRSEELEASLDVGVAVSRGVVSRISAGAEEAEQETLGSDIFTDEGLLFGGVT